MQSIYFKLSVIKYMCSHSKLYASYSHLLYNFEHEENKLYIERNNIKFYQ